MNNGVTAHRGNSGEYPENTIPAFVSAVKLNVDWLELDIYRTKDGKLVVSHDSTTKRVGDVVMDVTEATYEELKTVDVAHQFRKSRNLTKEQCPKGTIPLLTDVIQLVKLQHKTRLSIQPKMDCVAEAIQTIKRMKAENWVGFNDGNLDFMKQAKQSDPNLPVFWDRYRSDVDEDIDTARKWNFETIVMHCDDVTREKIDKIHRAGIEAGAWTINDTKIMKQFLKMGIDRLYTDYPAKLLGVKAEFERGKL